jgi:ABC-2 type transport system ATP-binding protein
MPSPSLPVPPALLTAEGLVAGYAGEPVCGPVDLGVGPGERIALIGPNGTGKSTLLKGLTGRQRPVAGEVRFAGAPQDEGSLEWRRRVCVLLDDEYFLPHLTVGEHLEAVALAHGLEDPRGRALAELERWGVGAKAGGDPQTLSSGQRRRFLLAAAFLRPADLMVLDEPEQRLDAATRRDLAEALADRAEDGVGLIFATHDAAFLARLADRCVILDDTAPPRIATPAEGLDLLAVEGS